MARNKSRLIRLSHSESLAHSKEISNIEGIYAYSPLDSYETRKVLASKKDNEINNYMEEHGLTYMNGGFYVEEESY